MALSIILNLILIVRAYAPRTRLRNSSRVRGSSRITPSRRLVVSVDPSVFTPRNVMQLCSASITTPTPCGLRMSWMASAISAASFSWICRRRANPCTTRASLEIHHHAPRQVADVRATDHRQHVMLTKADHADVPQHHQFVVTADFHEGTL